MFNAGICTAALLPCIGEGRSIPEADGEADFQTSEFLCHTRLCWVSAESLKGAPVGALTSSAQRVPMNERDPEDRYYDRGNGKRQLDLYLPVSEAQFV